MTLGPIEPTCKCFETVSAIPCAVPEVPAAFVRERLFRLLDTFRASAPVTWIGAPPGSGKTTLIASYVQARAVRCIWHRIEPGDRDPAALLHRLVATLDGPDAGAARPRPRLAAAGGARIDRARSVFADLRKRFGTPLTLVFDGLDVVEPAAALHGFLSRLDELPAGMHAVLISRTPPPAVYERLRRGGRLNELDPAELRLTAAEVQSLADFLRRADEAPAGRDDAAPAEEASGPSPEVRVYTLGRFGVVVRGRTLTFATKAQRKPLALLKALIAMGGRSVREDRLLAALWPDAEPERAAAALTSTVHRLRRLIGRETVERREGRITLDARRCWVDAWALERRLAAAERLCRPAAVETIERTVDELLDAYRGPFLDDHEEHPWLLAPRERIRERLLRALARAAEALRRAGLRDAAVRCLKRALEVDPLAEPTYRLLMQVQLERGERAEGLAVYERCRSALATHYGVAPSPATEAVRARILDRVAAF